MLHATAGVTIKWNTRAPAPAHDAVQSGTLTALSGTHATVRMHDGTYRTFITSQKDVAALRALIGKAVIFRVR